MKDFTKAKARDLMRAQVQRLEAGMPIDRAVALFEEAHISGAPVVDAQDRVLGILSLSDVASAELAAKSRMETSAGEYSAGAWRGDDEDFGDETVVEIDELSGTIEAGDTVADWMTQEIVSVAPDATLREVCRVLAENRIHRVLVVEHKKLCGIITNSDVVRWIAEQS